MGVCCGCGLVCVCVSLVPPLPSTDDLADSEIDLARKVVAKWRRFRYMSVRVRPHPHTSDTRAHCAAF